ncbi:MAG: NACHT domain-containing protein [Stackebrandtia sp.]
MATHSTVIPTLSRRRKLLWAWLALGSVAGLAWIGFPEIRDSPAWSFAGLATWLAVLPAASIAVPARDRADVDETAAASLPGLRRRYARLLAAHADRVPLLGLVATAAGKAAAPASAGEPALPLTSVYVDVRIRPVGDPDASSRSFVGAAPTRRQHRPFMWLMSRRKSRTVLLTGGPGTGKTTAMRRAALELCASRKGRRSIPVLLELPRHAGEITAEDPPDLAEIAASAPWLHGAVPATWLRRKLRAGRCVVMVDGIDEVGADSGREAVADWIREQTARFSRSSFAVACRDAGRPPKALSETPRWQLRRFAHAQMSDFLERWYLAGRERGRGPVERTAARDRAVVESGVLMSRLHAHPGRFDLASNPLCLTMLALVNRTCGFLPTTREELHAEVSDLLLHGETRTDAGHAGRRAAQKETVVRRLARYMMDHHCAGVAADVAREQIFQTLLGVLQQITPEEFLAEATDNGLLVCDGQTYSFAHMSLQEYFTALDFHERYGDAKLAAKIDEEWWREVIVRWAAHTDASRAVRACLQSGKIDALALAYDCARHARALAPEVRARLESLLHVTSSDAEQNLLLGAVKATRELRRTVELGRGRTLTARPVSRDLYASFLAAQHPGSRPVDDDRFRDAPAMGMWAEDAARFVDWVNGLPRHDDAVYRLPEPEDLADPMCDLSRSAAGKAVWVAGEHRPRLYRTRSAHSAFTLDPGWRVRSAREDRRRGALLLYLLSTVMDAKRGDLTRDLAGVMDLERGRAYDLPRELAHDEDLAATRRFLGRRDFDLDDPKVGPHLDRIVDQVSELSGQALKFRGVNAVTPIEAEPFTYLDELGVAERRRLAQAYTLLRLSWAPSQRKYAYGKALEEFDEFLAGVVPRDHTDQCPTVRPERLRESLAWLGRSFDSALPPERGDSAAPHALARRLVSSITDELTATLTHGTSYDAGMVSCARTGLVAAAAVVYAHMRARPKAAERAKPVLEHLATAVAGLTVLECRVTGRVQPNEVILLVRD